MGVKFLKLIFFTPTPALPLNGEGVIVCVCGESFKGFKP